MCALPSNLNIQFNGVSSEAKGPYLYTSSSNPLDPFASELTNYCVLADTRVNHTGVLAVGNYSGSSLVVGIFTFVVNSLYGFNYAKINL